MAAPRIPAFVAALALAAALPGCVVTDYVQRLWQPCGDEVSVREADARHQEALAKPDIPAVWAGITPESRAAYDRSFALARSGTRDELRKLPVADEITVLAIRQHYAGRPGDLATANGESFLRERPGIGSRQRWEIARVHLGRDAALVDTTRGGRPQVQRRYECISGAWAFDSVYMNRESSSAAEALFRQGRVARDDFIRNAVASFGAGTPGAGAPRLEDFILEQPGIDRNR